MVFRKKRSFVNVIGDRVDKTLNQRRQSEYMIQIWWNVAHANFDRTKVVVRSNVPPDFSNGIDEAGGHQVLHKPDVLTPVSHLIRKPGRWQAFHNLRTIRLQPRASTFPER